MAEQPWLGGPVEGVDDCLTHASAVLEELAGAWERSDRIFGCVPEDALLEQPIPLRQPFIFYLGHLPAFSWNQLGRGLLGAAPMDAALDDLFARGIDPVGVDAFVTQRPELWPHPATVLAYRDRVRAALGELASRLDGDRPLHGLVLGTVLEHELMHQETLLYMMWRLPLARLRRPAGLPAPVFGESAPPGRVAIPAGPVVLGRPRTDPGFGWDNEFPEQVVDVAGFAIERTPVRNRDFLEFMDDGGYDRPQLWTAESWAWRQRQRVTHPLFWRREDGRWLYRTVFDELPLEGVLDWPVSVSWGTASAFARWRGGALPTEAELHRAAYASPEGSQPRAHPWGQAPPAAERGNFGFQHWSPTPAGACPRGASAWDVLDLVGNGWEWTSTPFAPLPGFEPMSNYPGYSADFFDRRHYVMLGASWATDTRLVRRSFRNWFQPDYPYVFTKFRCVYPDDPA